MFVYKNLHLNSLCIYCFTLISMTRKRGSGPWQKMVINKMYWQENNVRHRLQTKHINNKNVHYHPFRSLNEYVWQQIDIYTFKVKFKIWSKNNLWHKFSTHWNASPTNAFRRFQWKLSISHEIKNVFPFTEFQDAK